MSSFGLGDGVGANKFRKNLSKLSSSQVDQDKNKKKVAGKSGSSHSSLLSLDAKVVHQGLKSFQSRAQLAHIDIPRAQSNTFKKMATQAGLTQTQIDAMNHYISSNFEAWVAGGQDLVVKKGGKAKLARTIEYIAENQSVVIHFKRKKISALGEGQFSIVKQSLVHTSRQLAAGTDIADKVPKDKSDKSKAALQREGQINLLFREASHVRKVYRVGDRGILLEGMEQPLKEIIKSKGLSKAEKVFVAQSIVEGLQEIRDKGYVHQDLHSGNVFCSWDGDWKIGDLGSAEGLGKVNHQPVNLLIASPSQMAAQVCKMSEVSQTGDDLWSLGILMYELQTGAKPAFANPERAKLLRQLIQRRDELLKEISLLPTEQQKKILCHSGREPCLQVESNQSKKLASEFFEIRGQLRTLHEDYLREIKQFREQLDREQGWEGMIYDLLDPNPEYRGNLGDARIRLEQMDSVGALNKISEENLASNNNNIEEIPYGAGVSSDEDIFDDVFDEESFCYTDQRNETSDTYLSLLDPTKGKQESSVQVELSDGQRLQEAIHAHDIEAVEDLILRGCDVAAWRDYRGQSPLHLVAFGQELGSLPVMQFLLNIGADPNAKDNVGNTPLHLAVTARKIRECFALWESGADAEIPNEMGLTPIAIADSVGVGYLDENRLLLGSKPPDEDYSSYTEWYLNQAAMLEFTDEIVGVSEDARRRLGFLLIYSYYKAAPHGKHVPKRYGLQVSPLFNTSSRYYRSTPSEITEGLRRSIHFELTGNTSASPSYIPLRVVANSQFREIMARKFSVNGVIPKFPLDGNLEPLVEVLNCHQKEFWKFRRKKLEKKVSGEDPVLLLDLSQVFEEHPEFLKDSNAWNNWWQKQRQLASDLEVSLDNSSIQPFALIKHRDLDVLFFPGRGNQALFDTNFLVGQIDPLMCTSGAVLSADRTMEAWIQSTDDMDKVIRHQSGVGQALFSMKGKGFPQVFAEFGHLLDTQAFKRLQTLMADDTAAPYVRIMAEATYQLIRGLEPLGVDKAFTEEGLEGLLQWIYYKMINSLGEAYLYWDDLVPFLNSMEVLHQEVQNILAIVSLKGGYGPSDFSQLEVARLMMSGELMPPVVSSDDFDPPKVALTPSAMGGVSTVLSAVEAQKGSGQLNVLVLKDSYYENTGLLMGNRSHATATLDGDLFTEDGQLQIDKDLEGPVDLFVAEFNHNISLTREDYQPERVSEQVLALLKNGHLASPCTVLLDTTIEVDPDQSIRDFIQNEQIKELIQAGELNVVSVRSAQKFDMLGMDNYYGGIVTAVNANAVLAPFNEYLARPELQQGGLAYQGMTHLKTCLEGTVQKYREAVHGNLEKLYALVPAKMKVGVNNTNPVRISKLHAGGTVFLDIKASEHEKLRVNVLFALMRMAEIEGIPLTRRASFGFPTTNVVEIVKAGMRLTPGLEGDDIIERYGAFFRQVQDLIDNLENKGAREQKNWLDVVAYHVGKLYRRKKK